MAGFGSKGRVTAVHPVESTDETLDATNDDLGNRFTFTNAVPAVLVQNLSATPINVTFNADYSAGAQWIQLAQYQAYTDFSGNIMYSTVNIQAASALTPFTNFLISGFER